MPYIIIIIIIIIIINLLYKLVTQAGICICMGNKNDHILGYAPFEQQVHSDASEELDISIHGHNWSDDAGSRFLCVATAT
jgi:hypothetical protein